MLGTWVRAGVVHTGQKGRGGDGQCVLKHGGGGGGKSWVMG